MNDGTPVEQPPNPFDSASFINRTTFFWLNSFIIKGFNKTLSLSDIYVAPKCDSSRTLSNKLRVEWHKELRKAKSKRHGEPSLLRAMSKAFGFWYILGGLVELLCECVARPLQAVALGWIITDVNEYMYLMPTANDNAETQSYFNNLYWKIFYDGLVLIFMSILSIITMHPFVFVCQHTGMQIRVAVCQLIYSHSLKLSNAAIGQTTVGQLVNLLSNDVDRFDFALIYVPYLVIAPIQALVSFLILSFFYLGLYSTLAGAILLLLYVPFQTLMGQYFGKLRQSTAIRTDERIRLMNEIIPAMRVIKMYAWEKPFAKLVELSRAREVDKIRHSSILRGINMALFFVSSKVILFVCLITYVLLGYTLEPQVVFVGISLLQTVRLLMTLFFPYGVAQLAESLISISRIEAFLSLPCQLSSPLVDRLPTFEGLGVKKKQLKQQPSLGGLSSGSQTRVKFSDVGANWLVPAKKEGLKLKPVDSNIPHVKVKRSDKLDASIEHLASTGSMLGSGMLSNRSTMVQTPEVPIDDLDSSWTTTELAICALRGITFELKTSDLLVVVGRVGSGKSSVLLAMLGELPLAAGHMTICGSLSYAPQNAWVFAGSVRENVLFGKPLDQSRYDEVLRVCSLDKDIALLPDGDDTIVGERGVSLSGGQRARVNLARAVYHDADIYLLDDPLSAVDTVVAKQIYNECICGFLKKKTVVLATHQTQLIQRDTTVLYMEACRQVSCKKLFDNTELMAYVGSNVERSDSDTPGTSSTRRPTTTKGTRLVSVVSRTDIDEFGTKNGERGDDEKSTSSSGSATDGSKEAKSEISARTSIRPDEGDTRLAATQESLSDGDSTGLIYWYYVKACQSFWLIAALVLTNLLTQILYNAGDFWLSFWADTEQRRAMLMVQAGTNQTIQVDPNPQTITDKLTRDENAIVYSVLIGSLFFLSLLRTSCFFLACMRASIWLHESLFRSLLNAPIKFFDYNPIGALLNRVSRDIGVVDDMLPATAFDTVEIFINVTGVLISVAIVYPLSLIPAVILCAVVAIVRVLYMRTIRSIKAIETVTRSPVYTHLATSLTGLTTIRAFKVEQNFEEMFDHYQDVHSSAWFLFVGASRWLCCVLDWLSTSYIAVLTVTLTLSVGSVAGSEIGLAISSALMLSGAFQWGVRQSTELESYMTSVRRIKEYSELESEDFGDNDSVNGVASNPDVGVAKNVLSAHTHASSAHTHVPMKEDNDELLVDGHSWPSEGRIEFEGVELRYFEHDEPVLRDLSFAIEAREKIGIVGRTGAGKSSIIAALFRLTQPRGVIRIDGIDTAHVSLRFLRRKISIIPQEPILFSGSVRRNLDPFDEYADAAIWAALDSVKLRDVLLGGDNDSTCNNKNGDNKNRGLDTLVREGGSNFSTGERQLICLARAILRKNKILVLDEATANVDPQTDRFIQRTIRHQFRDCTVITIAHRLNTIMDCDRVLVLDAGKICEFDEPHALLQKQGPDAIFATMTANSEQQAAKFRRIAELASNKRRRMRQESTGE